MKANITTNDATPSPIAIVKRHGVIYHRRGRLRPDGRPELALLMCANSGDDRWILADPFESTFYLCGKPHKWCELEEMLVDYNWEPAPAGTRITFENVDD